ncbi:beta strand repeat-containing protein, partial [Haemophilus influenzae]|uniref:beta strand repeat-containing protein n=1 Tax=Haemophilus influenzae TaxID=727 RepID=UPI000DD3C714
IRNKGKLSADSVSKDKSGNIVLSAKEGEAEIGGVISAQNQQAKGGKLMITGDKVTLKTGAVIDLSGKEGGETYLGGDERGEGKNGIQLAKKTTLEKGSTINVSGKEKGGRAIVWGDIALINGNINAQGKDIAKTGGFVETSGHDLSIGDDVIVDAKEWLLDPENVNIINGQEKTDDLSPRGDNPEKKNDPTKNTINTGSIEQSLRRGSSVNISATKKVNVTADINVHNGTLTLHSKQNGVEINGNITSTQNGNLTIKTGGRVDVHKNITLGMGFLNITSDNNIAFEKGDNLTITAQGNIISNQENKQLRFSNVSLNGMGAGLTFTANKGNHTHKFDGTLNISGKVVINQTTPHNIAPWNASADSYWNVTTLTLGNNAQFTFIKFVDSNRSVALNSGSRSFAGVKFYGKNNEMKFNIGDNANVEFKLKSNDNTSNNKPLPIQFLSNISATGNGTVSFDIHANLSARSTELNMSLINISNGVNFSINSHVRGNNAFEIKKDLIINATGSNFNLKQTKDKFDNSYEKNAIFSTHNLTILGGNVTLGGENSSSNIKGNININSKANVTLQAHAGTSHLDKKERTLTLGNVSVGGNLNIIGSNAHIDGNLSIAESAKFQGKTNNNLNITGTFTNNGTADINIKQGVVNIQGNITNKGGLNITTNAQNNQKTIINGNITNEGGDLNIKDSNNNAEIQIGGNISQKKGNLTISSDKINITKKITIKAGVDEGGSDSSPASNANLTIKTKTLELTGDLNISGFNKAEITAKNGNDLTIGKASDGNANAKKVTFDKVKDSKISAEGHGVTLNSKVESSGDSSTENGSDGNNIGLTISAKDVTVNSNITSHKTVNISASEGGITTKAGTTINATTGSVEVTAKTGDIKGGIESTSGSVTLTATEGALAVGNISGNTVTITADKGKLTTQANSKISATSDVTTSSQSGDISGTISGKTVSVTATTDSLTVKGGAKINATEGAATLTAESGKLTTQAGSSITSNKGKTTLTANNSEIAGSINATDVTLNTTGTLTTATGSSINAANGNLVINAQDATLNGDASGDRTEVNAVNASGSGNVTAATSSSVNITGDLNTINGLNIISENGRNTVRLRGKEIDVKYIQPGVASVEEVIEAKRVLEKVKDLSDEERETLAKLGVSAVRFVEPNNAITVNTQNEFTTRPSSQVTISEGKACFSSGNGAAVCTNVADDGQQ